jgi:hypothetical protein
MPERASVSVTGWGYQYFLVLLSGEVTMMDMDLTQLSSRDLAAIGRLLAKKETLVAQLEKLERELAAYSGGQGQGQGQAVKLTGRRKKSATGRGQLKAQILSALQAAGKMGLTVKDLAVKAGTKPANVYSWFYATGRKIKNIKKVGEARYAWIGV